MIDWHRFTEREIMAGNFFGEARMQEGTVSEDRREWIAIGNVVLNRAASNRWSANTPKSVILQRNQFSWTRQNDPSASKVFKFLSRPGIDRYYYKMMLVADAVLAGRTLDLTYGADHYVATWLYDSKRGWWRDMTIADVIGGHVFLISRKGKTNPLPSSVLQSL